MDEPKTIDETKPETTKKSNWILAGKIALVVVCALACVGSMWWSANRTAAMFDHDPWQEFVKNLTFDFSLCGGTPCRSLPPA